MKLGWILTTLKWLFGLLFGAGKGTRITFEARSEASIDAERKRIEDLEKEIQEIDNELATIAQKITDAILAGNHRVHRKLDTQRRKLYAKRHVAERRHLDAQRSRP